MKFIHISVKRETNELKLCTKIITVEFSLSLSGASSFHHTFFDNEFWFSKRKQNEMSQMTRVKWNESNDTKAAVGDTYKGYHTE